MKNVSTAEEKNNNIKSSLFNALFGVFAAVLVLSYSAYAWFTLSQEIVAKGINLTATAPDNVLISLTGEDGTWAESIEISNPDILETYGYDTAKEMLIIPASSYAGFNGTFFQTNKSLTNGQAMPDTLFDEGTPLAAYKDHYEGYYVDVPLYFKTEGSADVELFLEINDNGNGSSISPSAAGTDIYRTARAAFINPAGTANSNGAAAPLVFASTDRAPIGGVVTSSVVAGGATVAPEFISFDADGYSTATIISLQAADISEGTITAYPSQLILRIWIEGQDTYSTVAISGQSFNIDLRFAIKNQ